MGSPLTRTLGTLAVLTLFVCSTAASAALTPERQRCQRGAARAAAAFVKRSAAARAACHDRVSRGALPAATDCQAEAAGKLDSAAVRLDGQIRRKCADSTVAGLIFGADCLGTATVADLVTCIRATHEAQVAQLIGLLYVTDGELAAAGRRCQARASHEVRAAASARLRFLQKCKNGAAKGRLPAGVDCAEEPQTSAKIASRLTEAAAKIAAQCDAAALAEVDFGAPCAGAADGAELVLCGLSIGGAAADDAALVEYGDGGFCGDAHQAIEGRIDELLPQMTLAEKVDQMHGLQFTPINGLSHTPDNERLSIPGFRMVDGPRGVGAGNATAFPVGMARGATWDPALEERVGEVMGIETRAKGGSVILAPVINVLRHPRWGRAQETYGEDPLHLGRMGVGFIRGAQRHVIASAKHFAVNSIENTRFTVNVTVDERTLREIYLPHFRMAVEDAHVGSIMSAYNKVNGAYCAENPPLLRDILKGEWGFRGFVESDWVFGTRSTVPSALAGLDIEMPWGFYFAAPLVEAVEAGQVPMATIDDAVRRILRAKFCFRLDDVPPVPDPALVETPEHTGLALEVARQATVLLKNDAAALPLDRSQIQSLVVVGALADVENLGDHGSSEVTPSYTVTPLEGLVDRAGAVTVTHVTSDPLSVDDQAAIAAADAAIVVAGLTAADEGEGLIGVGDRIGLGLPGGQDQLISDVAALNARTIVVLEGGGAITMETWVDDVEAILMAWYPGQEGGNAIADILFGDVNPSAKLPITFPQSADDLPPFINDQDEVTYDYYHGYRHVDREAIAPRFPFGFGLSYTTYAYANLAVAQPTLPPDGTLQVSVDVTNTGGVAGDEIVQLYVSYQASQVDRPVRDLKGFAKVHLEPGETKSIALEIPVEELAFYDVGAAAWAVEPISYTVHVGSSSGHLPLSASFQVSAAPPALAARGD